MAKIDVTFHMAHSISTGIVIDSSEFDGLIERLNNPNNTIAFHTPDGRMSVVVARNVLLVESIPVKE